MRQSKPATGLDLCSLFGQSRASEAISTASELRFKSIRAPGVRGESLANVDTDWTVLVPKRTSSEIGDRNWNERFLVRPLIRTSDAGKEGDQGTFP